MNRTLIRRAAVATSALCAVGAGVAVTAPAASATSAATICADSLYVREQPAGVVIGTLYNGDHFDIDRYSPSREWVYGHAYGNVHQDGWVQSGWFC